MKISLRRTATALAVVAILASTLVPVAASAASPAPTPVVQGNRLVDSRTNTTFVPRGVNIPGLEYSCVQGWRKLPATGEFAAIASWKINTVRLPLNESCWLGLDGAPSGSTVTQYKADVATWVSGATAAGLVVILDLHWNAPAGYTASGQRAMPDERSSAFWTSVATTYSANPSVMFELFNEPYSRSGFSLSWDCWKNGGCLAPVENDATGTLSGAKYTVTGMQALVSAVRTAGATQPLLLGGLNYSNDLTGWLANKPTDPVNQLVAAWHNYPGQGCSTACWNSTITTVAASVPIVTTEFGNTAETTSTATGSGNYLVPFMTWAEANGIGYLPWAWWDVGAAEAAGNGSDIYALYTGSSFTPKAPSGTKFYSYLASLATTPAPAPAAGTLVKSTSSPTIYLVDGSSTLIPLAAFSSATDAGIPGTFATVAPSVLSSFTIASAPLTNVLSCPTASYVSGDSKAWPVDAALVSGLPSTPLAAATCATLPKGGSTISGALFVTPLSGGTIYSVTPAGVKRPILTMSTLGLMSAPAAPVYLHVGQQFLNSLTTGPSVLSPGSLVKAANSPTIYLADGFARLVPLASFAPVIDSGIAQGFFTLPAADLTGVAVAGTPLGNVVTCGGTTLIAGSGRLWPTTPALVTGLVTTALESSTCSQLPTSIQSLSTGLLVKGVSTPTIYSLSAGMKNPLVSGLSISSITAPGPAVFITVGDAVLATLPTGVEAVTTGMLVKTASSPTVSLVTSATTLVPLRTFESVSELGLPTAYSVVSPAALAGRTVSADPLSNLVSCGSSLSLAAAGSVSAVDPADVTGLPVTSLPSPLCGMLVTSPTTADPLLLKAPNSPTIYLVEAGKRRAIGSGSTFATITGGSMRFATVNAPFVTSIPLGAPLP